MISQTTSQQTARDARNLQIGDRVRVRDERTGAYVVRTIQSVRVRGVGAPHYRIEGIEGLTSYRLVQPAEEASA